MSQFLNTEKLNEWIPKLIDRTDRELVIIVPYIKTSDRLYDALVRADERGVETIIVYRELSLTAVEKKKLKAIDNLNLLHHPNVHAKCYMNEYYLIITSMNMYEHSQLHNREMGALYSYRSNKFKDKVASPFGDNKFVEEAKEEINAIINTANLEKESRETIEEGFEMEILKSKSEKAQEKCNIVNKGFLNKRFVVSGTNFECMGYSDKIDVAITNSRIEVTVKRSPKECKRVFEGIDHNEAVYKYEDFKFYWNWSDGPLCLYTDHKSKIWEIKGDVNYYRNLKKGIDALVEDVRKHFSKKY